MNGWSPWPAAATSIHENYQIIKSNHPNPKNELLENNFPHQDSPPLKRTFLVTTKVAVSVAAAASRSESIIASSVTRAIPKIAAPTSSRFIAELRRELSARWRIHLLTIGALRLLWAARIFRAAIWECDWCVSFCWRCCCWRLFNFFGTCHLDCVSRLRSDPAQANDWLEARWWMEQVAYQRLDVRSRLQPDDL